VSKDVHLDMSKKNYNALNVLTPNVLDAILKLNKDASFVIQDTTSKTVNAFPNAVIISTAIKSLLKKITVNLVISTVIFAMAHSTAESVRKDTSKEKEFVFLNAVSDTLLILLENVFNVSPQVA
jgi:hypothetical protein